MATRSKVALKVNDLSASIAFYERLGLLTRDDSQPAEADLVYMLLGPQPILLAGPTIEDVRSHLDAPRIVFKPGDTLDFGEDDLAVRRADLAEKGFTNLEEGHMPNGSPKLTLQDPNGYKIVFYQRRKRSPEEIVALYTKGMDELESLVAGLTDEQLNLRRSPTEWTIRQVVNHLADSDSLFLMHFKTALAQPGSTFVRPPYDQEHWVKVQDNEHRAIGPSLALSRAIRTHIVQLLQHIPDHWERSITVKYSCDDEGHKVTVGGLLEGLAEHLEEHCEEIRANLQKHELTEGK